MYVKKNSWAKWTAVNKNGKRYEYVEEPKLDNTVWENDGFETDKLISQGNDASDWQNSLIEIDAQDKPYVHEFVNDWAKSFFVDKNGKGYECINKHMCTNTSLWVYSPTCNGKERKYVQVKHNYKGDWKESLQIRKEVNETMDKDNNNNEWNGEGMPPTGTICEVLHNSEWERTYIVGKDELGNTVYDCEKIECQDNLRYAAWSCPSMFRPIQTVKQKIIEDAVNVIASESIVKLTDEEIATKLYDAGMLVDNYSNSNP